MRTTVGDEAKEYVAAKLRYKGEMQKSEVIDMLRPLYSFDTQKLIDEKLGRVAARLIRGIRLDDGCRRAFILKGEDSVIDIVTCKSLEKVAEVERRLQHQIEALTKSKDHATKRREQLEGQISLFEDAGSAR